jgi:plasmid stabilization system protein ParE
MKRRVRWTRLAEQDALDICLHIARDNADAAEKLLRRIDDVLATSLDQPRLGRSQPRYGEGVRSLISDSFQA